MLQLIIILIIDHTVIQGIIITRLICIMGLSMVLAGIGLLIITDTTLLDTTIITAPTTLLVILGVGGEWVMNPAQTSTKTKNSF